jgi:hypothetical protein
MKFFSLQKLATMFALLSSWTALLQAQEEILKWGKIPEADLTMTIYAEDPEAGAVFLEDHGSVKFDFRSEDRPVRFERHFRLKFLNDAGIDEYGNIFIPFVSHHNAEVVGGVKAIVYHPDGTEIPVGKQNMFLNEDNPYYSTQRISLPSLKAGAIAEVQYSILSRDIFSPVDWKFQYSIPVRRSQLEVSMPEWFEYIELKQGRLVDEESQRQKKQSLVGTNSKYLSVSSSPDVKMRISNYTSHSVPALKKEKHITTMEDYYSRLRYQLQSIVIPSRPVEPILSSWKKVEEELLGMPSFGNAFESQRNGTRVLEFAGISKGETMSQTEAAALLFERLNAMLQWNNRYTILLSSNIADVLERKAGTTADLNLTLVTGLRALGISAAPVLTSTRSHGKPLEIYPFLDQFNHVIVIATLDGKPTFMDLGDRYLPMGLLRKDALNYRGWRVIRDNSSWIDITPDVSKATYYFQLRYSPDRRFEGTFQGKFNGYLGYEERRIYSLDTTRYFHDHFQGSQHEWILSDIKYNVTSTLDQPWVISCNVSGTGSGAAEEYMYLAPPFPKSFIENPFKSELRLYPVEFNFPVSTRIIIDIEVPEGYVVESIPESKKFETEDGGIAFIYRSGLENQRIHISIEYSILNVRYEYDQYTMLNSIFDIMVSTLGEQIVLKKTA